MLNSTISRSLATIFLSVALQIKFSIKSGQSFFYMTSCKFSPKKWQITISDVISHLNKKVMWWWFEQLLDGDEHLSEVVGWWGSQNGARCQRRPGKNPFTRSMRMNVVKKIRIRGWLSWSLDDHTWWRGYQWSMTSIQQAWWSSVKKLIEIAILQEGCIAENLFWRLVERLNVVKSAPLWPG